MTKDSGSKKLPRTVKVDRSELDRIVDGTHHDPHAVLGPHPGKDGVTIRVPVSYTHLTLPTKRIV